MKRSKAGEKSPRLGAHLPTGKGLVATAETAADWGLDALQLFLRNPRGARSRIWKESEVEGFRRIIAQAGIDPVVAHVSYVVNPASSKEELYELACNIVKDDLARCEVIGAAYLVMHPGSKGEQKTEQALQRVASLLNRVFEGYKGRTMILLETMAGMGKEIGVSPEELAYIIERVERKEMVGVCLDTCHLWGAGYDVVTLSGLAGFLDEAERWVGRERIRLVHANDSQKEKGSRIDRHAPIGSGLIGKEGFKMLMSNSFLARLPFILETPPEGLRRDFEELCLIRDEVWKEKNRKIEG